MTEAEWLACDEQRRMMAYLESGACKRSLLLLSCACGRRLWHLLETTALREAVNTCERFADDEIDERAFRAAASATHPLMHYREEIFTGQPREDVMWAAYAVNAAMNAVPGYDGYSRAIKFYALAARSRSNEEQAAHIHLIRDIFGNPFRPSNSVPASVLAWDGGAVRHIAEAIYEDRKMPGGTFDTARLAILADALLDAGCEDEALLAHCRSEGPHVRGCWAVDAILGKS